MPLNFMLRPSRFPNLTKPSSLRIVISSPGDVIQERERTNHVVPALDRGYASKLILHTID